jgi:hypothetical protein
LFADSRASGGGIVYYEHQIITGRNHNLEKNGVAGNKIAGSAFIATIVGG